jgi:predicted alpha/beta-fold hydrolase
VLGKQDAINLYQWQGFAAVDAEIRTDVSFQPSRFKKSVDAINFVALLHWRFLHLLSSQTRRLLVPEHPPFRPNPLLTTGMTQTVAALMLKGRRSKHTATKHIVDLFDGDRLVIHDDQPGKWITGDRIAIQIHGLLSDHSSPYMVRVSDKLRRNGIRTIRVDLRGFGDSALISRSHINGGCSPDLQSVIDYVHRLSPLSKISLVGFSIGGNIVLKTIGQWGSDFPRHVDSAIAVSPPVDLNYTMWNLRRFGNRVYERYMMAKLKRALIFRRKHVAGLVDTGINPIPSRLLEFDDKFTAPIWGFKNAADYYEKCSSARLLNDIKVPTIVLASRDDPVVPFDMLANTPVSNHVDFVSTRTGGHLGFLSRGIRDPDRYWMDWRISQWIAAIDAVG